MQHRPQETKQPALPGKGTDVERSLTRYTLIMNHDGLENNVSPYIYIPHQLLDAVENIS